MVERRNSREVAIGSIAIGGKNAVAIQSMTNLPTDNVAGNVTQICELVECGCEIVRLAVRGSGDVKSLAEIKHRLLAKGVAVPIVADVHFSPSLAMDCLEVAHKVRINAGNFSDGMVTAKQFSEEEFLRGRQKLIGKLLPFFFRAKELKKAVRIGINCGSLAPRMVYKFGNTAAAMWESAAECVEVANSVHFGDIVLSFKASDSTKMIAANRMACAMMDERSWDFPIHLGVTEAGGGNNARIKSAVGIGSLLADGIGDTVRVSLTEDPKNEIAVAKDILQACGAGRYGAEIISCPSCGRTSYDMEDVLARVGEMVKRIPQAENLKIAIMGCMVNGLGEANGADFSVIGMANGRLSIFRGGDQIARGIPPEEICEKLEHAILHPGAKNTTRQQA
jgi:(E)-4-hydroxy-3-methylbut-2-enyl-diphosphate synthase